METNTTETETFKERHDITDDDGTDIEQITQKIEGKSIWYTKPRIVLCSLVVLLMLASTVAVGFYYYFASATSQNEHHLTTQEFAEEITEDLLVCQRDIECHKFNMTTDELNKIRNAFNAYDGNNDDKWDKQTFIKYYTEISFQDELFDAMDINNDSLLSYKEMVLYLLNIKDQAIIQTILVPVFDKEIENVYHANISTNSQLYWEYVAELFFDSFDTAHQGFITKDDYLGELLDVDFDFITFDEFIEWQFSNDNIQESIDSNLFNFTKTDDTTYTMQNLHLQHTLYNSSIVYGGGRRLLGWINWKKLIKCGRATAVCAAEVYIAQELCTKGIVVYCALTVVSAIDACKEAKKICF